ncbi:O-antigen ligase family protein [Janthinobacterium sp. hw3]|uniref:O-antigen ligase family protein n=1 Tax=Janthinobacterium fluminis TaxID=2987524 RepID=A0ABT5K2I5_9BURK|nr:O-antigen ligase family protein [Janthinobacterium fluminis]
MENNDRWLIGALALYFVINAGVLAFHGAPLREYDAPLRFLLAIPALLLLLAYPPAPSALWTGMAVGAISAGLFASWQQVIGGADRASGTTNPIQFGNISLLLGILCLAGLAWALAQAHKLRWLLLLVAGAILGMLGSLLTGSRGSWIALPFCIGLLAIHHYSAHGKRSLRIGLLILAGLTGLVTLAYALPQSNLRARIERAEREQQAYANTGNADSSVGARLEMWRTGLIIAPEHLWLGWGKDGYVARKHALVQKGLAAPVIDDYNHLHNDYLDALVKRGVAGLLALLLLYLTPLLLFARQLKRGGIAAQPYAIGGVLLCVSYILFSLTQSFTTHNNGVMMLSFLIIMLWSSLRARQRQPARQTMPPLADGAA